MGNVQQLHCKLPGWLLTSIGRPQRLWPRFRPHGVGYGDVWWIMAPWFLKSQPISTSDAVVSYGFLIGDTSWNLSSVTFFGYCLGCVTISSQRNWFKQEPGAFQRASRCPGCHKLTHDAPIFAGGDIASIDGHPRPKAQQIGSLFGRRSTTGMIPKFVSMKPDSKNSNCHSNCHHWHHLVLAFLFGTHRTDPLFCGAKKSIAPQIPKWGCPSIQRLESLLSLSYRLTVFCGIVAQRNLGFIYFIFWEQMGTIMGIGNTIEMNVLYSGL